MATSSKSWHGVVNLIRMVPSSLEVVEVLSPPGCLRTSASPSRWAREQAESNTVERRAMAASSIVPWVAIRLRAGYLFRFPLRSKGESMARSADRSTTWLGRPRRHSWPFAEAEVR
jgi:hypothetical protein